LAIRAGQGVAIAVTLRQRHRRPVAGAAAPSRWPIVVPLLVRECHRRPAAGVDPPVNTSDEPLLLLTSPGNRSAEPLPSSGQQR
jgi:hypothetical protein